MGRNHLAGRAGDVVSALMAAVSYNFCRLLQWLSALLCAILVACCAAVTASSKDVSAR